MGALARGAAVTPWVGQVLHPYADSAKLGGEMSVSDFSVSIGADRAAWWWRGSLSCSLSWVFIGMVAKLTVRHFYKQLNTLSHRSNNSTFVAYSSAFFRSSSLYLRKFLKAESVSTPVWNLVFQI